MTQLKVTRLIEEYGLTGIGEELEERWTRERDRSSLRSLAEYFNRELLRKTVENSNSEPLDGEIDNIYRLLTDEDVTSGVRQQARARLKQRNVDVDKIEGDFVTYQSIRTYLREHREATPPDNSRSPEDHRETKQTTIQQLTSRLTTVTEEALTELRNAGNLTLGQFDVVVTVQVHCLDCDSRVSVLELLKQEGCQCE